MHSGRIPRFFLCFILAVGLPLSGCVQLKGLKQSTGTVNYYALEYPSPSPSAGRPSGGIVRLRRFSAASLYSTDRLVIQGSPYSADLAYYHRWAVSPGAMITDLLQRDLTASGLFEAVLLNPAHLLPEYELTGTLETLRAIEGHGAGEAELTANVLFYPYETGGRSNKDKRSFQKRYQIRLPCSDKEPVSIVEALSRCMEAFSVALRHDLVSELQRTPEQPSPVD